MSTYGPFSTYAIALVLDQDSKWAPLVICMKDDERNRLEKDAASQTGKHQLKGLKNNTQRSITELSNDNAAARDLGKLTTGASKVTPSNVLKSPSSAVLDMPDNGGGHIDPKAMQKASELKNNQTGMFNNAHLVEALSAYLVQMPLGAKVESALKTERIPYITVSSNKQSLAVKDADKRIQLLYSVERTNGSWLIRAFTPTAAQKPTRSSTAQKPTRSSTVRFSEPSSSDLRQDPFDLDRLLLNRLYLLAGITAGRRQIHERLAHILTTHEGVHQPKPAATRGYIRTILQRGSDLLSSHLPQVVATSTVLSCAFAIALIWLKVSDCPNWMFSAARILFGLTSLTGVAAFVQALRQKQGQTPEDKQIEKISEMAIELRSELAQINLKVASGYACIDNTPLEATSALSPEGLLREIDEALHIKASFDSLDKVIATQSQNVSSDHKQKQEHRLHAYQNIVAAGSGVFTGFFTYEVGESVLKFIHASQFADDRSLQYWLFTKAGVSASLQGAGQSPAHAPVLPVVGEAHAEPGAEQTSVTTAQSINELDQLYHENFAHHELVGQAWLLTITIVVTWFAGYIGWHKPHDEHGGGHGHHG